MQWIKMVHVLFRIQSESYFRIDEYNQLNSECNVTMYVYRSKRSTYIGIGKFKDKVYASQVVLRI